MSAGLEGVQNKNIPLSIADEYAKAVADLEKIRPYEPNLVKAAWNVFDPSYTYRQQYNEYKAKRRADEKAKKEAEQLTLF